MLWHITNLQVSRSNEIIFLNLFFIFSISCLIDLFVCVDKSTLVSKDISSNYPTQYNGKCFEASQLTQNDPNLMVFAFVGVNVRNFKDEIAVGFLKIKREQLSLLGYHVVIVSSIYENIHCRIRCIVFYCGIHYPFYLQIPTWEKDIEPFIIQEINNKLEILGIQKKIEIY